MILILSLAQIDPTEMVRRTLVTNERTFWVLLLTLIVLGLYTFVTFLMQRKVAEQVEASNEQTGELINQRKLSVLPAFIVYFKDIRDYNRPKIRNIGKGVALNIEVEPVPLTHEQYRGKTLTFRALSYLQPDSDADLLVTYESFGTAEEQNRSGLNQDPRVSRFLNDDRYDLKIKFSDIEGRNYSETLKMAAGQCNPEPVKILS